MGDWVNKEFFRQLWCVCLCIWVCICVGKKGLTGYGESFIQGFKKILQANIGKVERGIWLYSNGLFHCQWL